MTGHSSSTTGCGVVTQRSPQVGMRAVRRADPLADRDVGVVAGEDVGETQLAPHLPEARVGVQEHAVPRGGEQLLVGAEAHHVQQQVCAADPGERVPTRETRVHAVVERDRPGEAEPAERAPHVLDEVRLRGGQPVDEQHLVAEPAEAEQVLEELPGVARLRGLLGDSAADDDAAGVHRSRQTTQSASACRRR